MAADNKLVEDIREGEPVNVRVGFVPEFKLDYGKCMEAGRKVAEQVDRMILGQETDLVYDPAVPGLCRKSNATDFNIPEAAMMGQLPPCTYCKGTGVITLLQSTEPCPACKG
jgi:hypothetical protein